MPTGLHLEIEVIGDESIVNRIDRAADRMKNLTFSAQEVFRALEAGEVKEFNLLKGRYVRTGALRDSLTSPSANGSIRESHATEIVFGSDIEYAAYQRKRKKSAVLVLKPTTRKRVASLIMDEIVGVDP